MVRNGKNPDELRERAVRMVLDHGHEYPLLRKAIESIGKNLKVNYEIRRATATFVARELDPQPPR